MFSFLRPTLPISHCARWRSVLFAAVGGLTEIGFSGAEATLLVMSHDGRGLFDLATGRRIARDDEQPAPNTLWMDRTARRVQGIGPSGDEWFAMAGLWGGALQTVSPTGWTVAVQGRGRDERAYVTARRDRTKWLVGTPLGEIRAFGFSGSGRHLVLATSSDVSVFSGG
jgi:hypothetical protein